MANGIERWRDSDRALHGARQSMAEALARLDGTQRKRGLLTSPAARLLIGLDLTGSRAACLVEARSAMEGMLRAVRGFGNLTVKAMYYRGEECCESPGWCGDIDALSQLMLGLTCEMGTTQIARILRRASEERERLSGVVFIGDHCEESYEVLYQLASTLGRKSVPIFIFHECAARDTYAVQAREPFMRLAELSGGVYTKFTLQSGATLNEMLAGIAAYSTQGLRGLQRLAAPATPAARQLHAGLRLMLGSGTESG